ncbi:MAG: flagellar protein FliS [Nitrosospira multiformis]|nr:flagellar protein FliS [Nitrosospira multiformis]
MYSVPRCGVNAYARVGLETGVIVASPHKLVLMLFEGARIALASALTHTRSGHIAARGEAISKAIAIINSGLQASLDIRRGKWSSWRAARSMGSDRLVHAVR